MASQPVDKPNYPIESVDNALRLLLELKEHRHVGVSEASQLLSVAPSTAHRILAMLQYRGFAAQDPDSRTYHAGPALLDLGLAAVKDMSLRRIARPELESLAKTLDETVHLVVLEGSDVRFIDCEESSKILRVGSRTGMLLPAHCTAGGKAVLAELSKEELHRLYPNSRLPKMTPKSIGTRAQLERQLEEVRQTGYAVNVGESEADLSVIAAPIRDSRGRAQGALAVALPASRFDQADVGEMATAALKSADTIGSSLP